MRRSSGAANIAGPSTSTEFTDPTIYTTATFENFDVPTKPVEDSHPEFSDPDLDNMSEFQSNDGGLSALRVNEEDEEKANRTMTVRTLTPTSFQSS